MAPMEERLTKKHKQLCARWAPVAPPIPSAPTGAAPTTPTTPQSNPELEAVPAKKPRTDGVDAEAFELLREAFLARSLPVVSPVPRDPSPPTTAPVSPSQGGADQNDNDEEPEISRPWRPASQAGPSDSQEAGSSSEMLDPELLMHPRSSEWTPSAKVASYVASRIRTLMGDARSPLRSECPRPSLDGKVAQMPVLDPRMATFLAKFIKDPKKGIDRSWRACQDKLLDALGPITMLLDRAEDARLSSTLISPEALSGWAHRAVVFFGNANCALSTERRRSFLIKVDTKLGDLADSEAGPVAQGGLFGEPFIKELGKFVNTFTSLDTAQTSIRKVFPWVFRGADRGRGRSSGHNAQVSRGQGSRQGQYQNNQLYTNFYPSRGWRGRGRGFRGGDNSSAAGKCNPRVLSMRGRPVSRLCESVGTDHVRRLGATNCSRFQDRVLWRTQAVDSSPTDPFLSLRGTPDRHRGRGLIRKTGHLQYRVAFTRFPEQYVCGREDGRGPAFCLEPTRIQRVVGLPPLQDGGHTPPQRCLATADWMVRLDLKDAYLAIPIFPPHRKFLQFRWRKQVFQFTSLPFGLSSAPWCFTKVLRPVVEYLRARGIRLILYLDDMLLLPQDPRLLRDQLQLAVNLLESLGFIINTKKSLLIPTQSVTFRGFVISLVDATLSLPTRMLSKIRHELRRALVKQTIPLRQIARILGLLSATIQAIVPGPLHYRAL